MAEDMIQAVDEAAELLKSLSGRSRLVLLCHLWEGEKSVGELARLAGVRETAASQQLALLRKDGIVAARRSGQTIFYSLCCDRATRVLETLHQLFCAIPPAPGRPDEMEARS
jgi:DNA-binding transcriptional ArsR family regulator